jgi:hypothetical protein
MKWIMLLGLIIAGALFIGACGGQGSRTTVPDNDTPAAVETPIPATETQAPVVETQVLAVETQVPVEAAPTVAPVETQVLVVETAVVIPTAEPTAVPVVEPVIEPAAVPTPEFDFSTACTDITPTNCIVYRAFYPTALAMPGATPLWAMCAATYVSEYYSPTDLAAMVPAEVTQVGKMVFAVCGLPSGEMPPTNEGVKEALGLE